MRTIIVNDSFQQNYQYEITEPEGRNFDDRFNPHLTPQEMLEAGVFDGVYFHDKPKEFPQSRFEHAKLSETPNPSANFFGIHASLSLKERQDKGWIYKDDPRGWFQRYCRYFMGRRIPEEDDRQIKRWRSYKRHRAAVEQNCDKMDWECRKKQRQSLLHWAYDSRKL